MHRPPIAPGEARVQSPTAEPMARMLAASRREIQQLRDTIVALEHRNLQLQDALGRSGHLLRQRDEQIAKLQSEMAARETEAQIYNERCVDVEERACDLARLITASERLLATRGRREALDAMVEVVVDLIGSEKLGIFELDTQTQSVHLLASMGIEQSRYSVLPVGHGAIGRVVHSGLAYVAEDEEGDPRPSCDDDLTACVPLKSADRVVGALAVFELLQQKTSLEPLDYKLFELISTHGGAALYCTRLPN